MEKKERQTFSEIVRASNLTRQRTLQINSFLIRGEFTETNKAPLFFS